MRDLQTVSRMYDFYNEISDDYEVTRHYLTSKDVAWFNYIEEHLDTLHLLDEKVYHCFECGGYPPKRKEEV